MSPSTWADKPDLETGDSFTWFSPGYGRIETRVVASRQVSRGFWRWRQTWTEHYVISTYAGNRVHYFNPLSHLWVDFQKEWYPLSYGAIQTISRDGEALWP